MFDWLDIALDYINIMRYLVLILSLVMAIYSFHIGTKHRDPMQFVVGFSRLLISAIYFYLVMNPDVPQEFRVLITTGFIVLFTADGFVAITDSMTQKFKLAKELNQMKIALARMSDKTHFILDSCPVGIFQYSCTTFRFVYVNTEFANYFGKDPSWFIGKSILDGVVPEERLAIQKAVADRLAVEDKSVLEKTIHIITPPPEYKNAILCTESKLVFNGEATIIGYAKLVQ